MNWNSGYTPWYQQPQQQQPQQANESLVYIRGGEQAASNYLVAPNQTVYLVDNEAGQIFIKSTNISGTLMPLRRFEEVKPEPPQTQNFVTRDEFEKRLQEVLNAKPSAEQ